jgi:hypothetical protein
VSLNAETQACIGEVWTQLTDAAGVDRGAFVSEGPGAMAANANVDAGASMRSFSDVDDAVTWATN